MELLGNLTILNFDAIFTAIVNHFRAKSTRSEEIPVNEETEDDELQNTFSEGDKRETAKDHSSKDKRQYPEEELTDKKLMEIGTPLKEILITVWTMYYYGTDMPPLPLSPLSTPKTVAWDSSTKV